MIFTLYLMAACCFAWAAYIDVKQLGMLPGIQMPTKYLLLEKKNLIFQIIAMSSASLAWMLSGFKIL